MAEKNTQDPTTGTEAEISKAKSQQQPAEQAKQQPETGEERGQFEQDLQTETLTEQQTDVEVGPLDSAETGQAESSFVGSKGEKDSSGEFVEKDEEEEGRKGDGE